MILFVDLKIQHKALKSKTEERTQRVFVHRRCIVSPEIVELENKIASYLGAKHCIATCGNAHCLFIAMMELGINAGDEVITTRLTFVAAAEKIASIGIKPVYVDIDAETYNINPARIETAISAKTKAIMPVSRYGQCADMDAINAIADKHGLSVIEDAAQSFGSTDKGKKSCAISTVDYASFFPRKPLGAYGDGGALFTDNDILAKAMREIRLHGQDRRQHYPRIGINGCLETIQAAVLLAKPERLDGEVAQRLKVAATYSAMLDSRCPNATTPYIEAQNTSANARFASLTKDGDAAARRINKQDVPTAIHYPVRLKSPPAHSGDFEACPTLIPTKFLLAC